MLSMKAFITFCLWAGTFVQSTFAFVSSGSGNMLRPSSARAASSLYHFQSLRSVKPLRMAGGDGMSAAEEEAKRLIDQAAALRESAAESEAELRPPSAEVDAAEQKPAPAIRPEDMPRKPKISNDMRQRLKRELTSQGADPNKSAGNPILVIAGIIAVLVIVGGQGIFY